MGNFYHDFELTFLCDSSKLDEFCSKYGDCEISKSKGAALIKKTSKIFSESHEKEKMRVLNLYILNFQMQF